MSEDKHVAEARIEVERARARLIGTAGDLQERLKPKTLAREAWEGAKVKGADLAEEAVDAVKSRPFAATGVAAAIAMFLAREPLIGIAGKMVDGWGEKRAQKKRRKAASRKPVTPRAAARGPAAKKPRSTRAKKSGEGK